MIRDQDNDILKDNCVLIVKGGWWFYDCLNCDFNGFYWLFVLNILLCVFWYKFGNENCGMKMVLMMIRFKI